MVKVTVEDVPTGIDHVSVVSDIAGATYSTIPLSAVSTSSCGEDDWLSDNIVFSCLPHAVIENSVTIANIKAKIVDHR